MTRTTQEKLPTGGGGTPGGDDTQIQFNDGGSFGGAKLEYTEPTATSIQVKVPDQPTTDTQGYDLIILGGIGNGDNGEPGAVNIIGAPWASVNNAYTFGNVNVEGGTGTTGNGFSGGYVNITGGRGDTGGGAGGYVNIVGGEAETGGRGGTVNITGGESHGDIKNGGVINITGGAADGADATGGDVNIHAGTSNNAGNTSRGGNALLRGGAALAGDNDGGDGFIRGGNGSGSGNGGIAGFDGGEGGETGNGGGAQLFGGNGGATSGDGGDILLNPGRPLGAGNPGRFLFLTPESGGTLFGILNFGAIISTDKTYYFPNATGQIPTLTTGSGAPGSTPAAVGIFYLDTTNHKLYVSDATSGSGDWRILN